MDLFKNPLTFVLCYIIIIVSCLFKVEGNVKCSQPRQLVCGDNMCCCDNPRYSRQIRKAVCQGWKSKLQYIPKLPYYVTGLWFMNNNLRSLTKNTFVNISAEKYYHLVLVGNDIQSVSENTFSDFQHVNYLDFNDNPNINITQLRVSLMKIRKMRSLHINNINLTHISDDFFAGINVNEIEDIHIGNNPFRVLNLKAFNKFQALEKLTSTNGEITEVSKVTRNESFNRLMKIRLNKNGIFPHQPNFCSGGNYAFPYLRIIDLSFNNIRELKHQHWSCLKVLEQVYLGGNLIAVIHSNTFSLFSKLFHLRLKGMKGNIQFIHKYAFNSSSLKRLDISCNNYNFHKTESRDIFKFLPSIMLLDISNNNMANLSRQNLLDIFSPVKSLQTLSMYAAKMHNLPSDFLKIFPNISDILLYGNFIQNIDRSFQSVTTLRRISLAANRITVVHKNAFSANFIRNLEVFDLSNNPFECNCELYWFRYWISETQANNHIEIHNWPYGYHCNTPSSYAGKKLVDFVPTRIICSITTIVLCTVIPGSLLTVLIINFVLYRRRWHIVYYFYKLRRNRNANKNEERRSLLEEHNSVYDGYVIYHDEDREFVHTHLKEIVEDKHHLRLHIWHRDAGLGSKMEVMFDAIHASRNVLVVVSKDFLKDNYCHFQLEVAFERSAVLKKKNVFFILLDTIELKTLNKNWCVMFTKTPTLTWTSKEDVIKKEVFEQELLDHLTM